MYCRLFLVIAALLIGGAAWAQEPRGYIGADLQDITKEEAEALGWETPRGAKVVKPREGGPAAKAGVLAGDVIVLLDGQEVENMKGFVEQHRRQGAGGAGAAARAALGQGAHADRDARPAAGRDGGEEGPADPAARHRRAYGAHQRPCLHARWQAARVGGRRQGHPRVGLAGGQDRAHDPRAGGPGDEGKIFAMALSPDGRAGWRPPASWLRDLACATTRSARSASTISQTGKLIGLFTGHANVVNSVAFSPDGKKLISGSSDRTAIIWDVESRTMLHRLMGHKDRVSSVAFTPDGARAVTASDDTTLRLWRVSDGGLIAEMTGHTKDIDRGLAIRTSDSMIASGDATGRSGSGMA